MSIREKLEGLFDPVFLRLRSLYSNSDCQAFGGFQNYLGRSIFMVDLGTTAKP